MYDLVIATSTFFGTYQHVDDEHYREGLWEWFLESLLASKIEKNVVLAIADDGSPNPLKLRRFPFSTIYFLRNKNIGYNANIIGNLNMVAGLAPLCLTVDSDAYFAPDWMEWLYEAIERYPHAGGWMLFNSPRHLSEQRREGDFLFKNTSCLHGLCYRTADRPVVSTLDYVEHFIYPIHDKRGDFVVPRISKIQHTGRCGFNNKPLCSQDYDPLFPYNDRCGLANVIDRTGFENVVF